MRHFRILSVALACITPVLVSCVNQPWSVDRQIEQDTAREHSHCLSMGFPAYSTGFTDCMVALYEQMQRHLDRLRAVVAPAPPPVLVADPKSD